MNDRVQNKLFSSNGKLMISGEYLVLKGAWSFAIPLQKGQSLTVSTSSKKTMLNWKTFVEGQFWFEANYSLPELAIGNTNDFQIAHNLRSILLEAGNLNKEFLSPDRRIEVQSYVNFDIKWGLGSSSSLVSNIAQWAGVDPFELNSRVSEGSGYDVAAAMSDNPILYQRTDKSVTIEEVSFFPDFQKYIYFAYLGKKQNTSAEVSRFLNYKKDVKPEVKRISEISRKLTSCQYLPAFIQLLKEHDKIISSILNLKPVKTSRFPDFNGYVKSLGAWGGDFAMFITDYPRDYLSSYLRKKDIKSWFPYEDIVKPITANVDV